MAASSGAGGGRNSGRKRRMLKLLSEQEKAAPVAEGATNAKVEEFEDCPSDGCSLEGARPDGQAVERGSQSDGSSTEDGRARTAEQLSAMRESVAPSVKRKRRVLKVSTMDPSLSGSWEMVSVDEGNCPSDGCSMESAAPPGSGDETFKGRGAQAGKHSSEDGRERLQFQMERLKDQREADKVVTEAAAAAKESEAKAVKAAVNAAAVSTATGVGAMTVIAFSGYMGLHGLHPDAAAVAAIASSTAKTASSSAGIDAFLSFIPVCPASDGVFRVGQKFALSMAGDQNIENYRPLINDVLIRVRTELCVLESFIRETAYPFIKEKGVGWVLPLHETSETYLAGVVFMVGANFILLGSTKVVAIIAIYHDLSVGLLARLGGGLLGMATPEADQAKRVREFDGLINKQMEEVRVLMMDSSLGKSEREAKTAEVNRRYSEQMEMSRDSMDERSLSNQTSPLAKIRQVAGAVSVPIRLYGKASGMLRQGLEVFDTFCSRYFVAFTVTYIIVKTTHYVVFPDLFA